MSPTFGPHGRNAFLDRVGGLLITKDGVSVAWEIQLPDPLQNLGCKILRESAIEVNRQSGDGTTATLLIAGSLLKHLHRMLIAGADLQQSLSEIKQAQIKILEALRKKAKSASDPRTLHQVTLISANADVEIADIVTEAVLVAGSEGFVSVTDGRKTGLQLRTQEGTVFDRGWVSEKFSKGQPSRKLEDPVVALFAQGLTLHSEMAPAMEEASRYERPLLVIAPYVYGEALATMILNDEKDVFSSCAVYTPGSPWDLPGILKDLAALTGATIVDKSAGRFATEFELEWLGGLVSSVVTHQKTILVSPIDAEDRLDKRMGELRAEADATENAWEKEQLLRRAANLTESLVAIEVAKFTDAETRETKSRLEDALHAAQGALREGVVPGAGATYAEMAFLIEKECPPLAKALLAPVEQLAKHAGVSPGCVVEQLRVSGGWDPVTNSYRDLSEEPAILDSLQTVVCVIQSAVSAVTTLATSEAAILGL